MELRLYVVLPLRQYDRKYEVMHTVLPVVVHLCYEYTSEKREV